MEILSERLKILRSEKSWNQEETARELGLSYRSYRRYEGEGGEPNASTLAMIARFYGVSVDYLLGLKDNR